MNYHDIINSKSFKDNLTYLNIKIKDALQQQNYPLKLIGNIFYGHNPGSFFNNSLLPEQEKKRDRFVRVLTNKTNMFEIGINGGHSSLLALESNPTIKIVANDIAKFYPPCPDRHPEVYVPVACSVLTELYPDRFTYLFGDCLTVVPKFVSESRELFFDAVHLDGRKDTYTRDFNNLSSVMTPDCSIIFDDMQDLSVVRQVDSLIQEQRIKIHPEFPRMDERMYTHEVTQLV